MKQCLGKQLRGMAMLQCVTGHINDWEQSNRVMAEDFWLFLLQASCNSQFSYFISGELLTAYVKLIFACLYKNIRLNALFFLMQPLYLLRNSFLYIFYVSSVGFFLLCRCISQLPISMTNLSGYDLLAIGLLY